MKHRNKMIGIIIAFANIVLIIISFIFYLRTDRIAPRLEFQAGDLIYVPGMKQEELLQDITALDERDGDVSDRIVVEKIVENTAERKAIIYYAVSDQSGNVTKKSREVAAIFPDTKDQSNEEENNEPAMEQTPKPTIEPTVTPEPTPTATPEPTATPKPTPTPKPTDPPEEEQELDEPEEPEPEKPSKPVVNSSAPVLTLKTSEVNTKVGQAPAWVNVIQILKDDKDSYETLFGNIKISKYDVNKAGNYTVTVSTEDSDGNTSVAVPITIHVK